MNIKGLTIGLLFSGLNIAIGQSISWDLSIQAAKLFQHTEKMKFTPGGLAAFGELKLFRQTTGTKAWQREFNLPKIGMGLRYMDFGKPSEILGDGFGIYPFIDFPFLKRPNSNWQFMIGCGLAYVIEPYHIRKNPLQTAIGSHWNNLTTFQIRYERQLFQKQYLFAGLGISHISNGAFKSPNLGLNFLALILGYGFQKERPSKPENEIANGFSKWSWALEYGSALRETRVPGGPKYLIRWVMVDAGYQYNPFRSWRLGVDVEQNNLASYHSSYTEQQPDKKSAFRDGLRLNVYAAHQWLFGDIALSFRSGYQFLKEISLSSYPIVTKLDLCYMIPGGPWKHYAKPYIGFSLKTHFGTAEYIGLMVGLRFYHIPKHESSYL